MLKIPVRRAIAANYLAYWRETGYPLLGMTETPELFQDFCAHWSASIAELGVEERESLDPDSIPVLEELKPAFSQALIDLEAVGF